MPAPLSIDASPRTDAPSVLWIGRGEHPEFAAAAEALRRAARMVECRTMPEALELDPADDAAVIVVAEARPGEHDPRDYERLRRRRPGVPVVRVYGSLCEGERRTNPPPAALRVPWLRAASVLAAEWQTLLAGRCPTWGRTAAASEEEHLLADVPPSKTPSLPLGCVGLCCREPAMSAWLGDELARHGVRVTRIAAETVPSGPPPDALVWPLPCRADLQQAELTQLRDRYPATPLVALAGFPRVDEVARLRAAGVTVVLSQPLAPGELATTLTALAPLPS